MATFDWTGDLPKTKAKITSAQLRSRYGDLKTHINTNNPVGLILPATNGIAGQVLSSDGAGNILWESDLGADWVDQTTNFTVTTTGRYIVQTGVTTITLSNSPALGDEFVLVAGNGLDLSSVTLTQAASAERINGTASNLTCDSQTTMVRGVVVNTGSTGTGWRVTQVANVSSNTVGDLLVPSSDPAPYLAIPRGLPVDKGYSSFSSSGNFTQPAGTSFYTDFTINAGHQMQLEAGVTVIQCTGTITIAGNGVLGTTGTASTVGDSFVLDANGTAGTNASTGGIGGAVPSNAGTNGDAGSAATGLNVLGGTGRGGGGRAATSTGAGGNSATPAGNHGGGGGGGGSTDTSGSNANTNGNGGNGGTGGSGTGGSGGSVGSAGSAGADSENVLILIANAGVFSADINLDGATGSAGSNGSNGSNGISGQGGGGGGGGGGAGGAGGAGGKVICFFQTFTRTAGSLTVNGGTGGAGGNGGNGGSPFSGTGTGGAGAGGPGGPGGTAGWAYIEYASGTLSGGSATASAGAAGAGGSSGTGSGLGGAAGASGAGRTFANQDNVSVTQREVFG